MDITEYFEELISDYNLCYQGQFNSDVRLLEEVLLILDKHCFVLNSLMRNVGNETADKLNNIHNMVWSLHSRLETIFEERPSNTYQYEQYTPTRVRNGLVGRPKAGVTAKQISFLQTSGCTWTDISCILKISRRSLFRYREMFNLKNHFISEEELASIIQEVLRKTPGAGEVYVLGALRAKHCNVPRWRVQVQFSSNLHSYTLKIGFTINYM